MKAKKTLEEIKNLPHSKDQEVRVLNKDWEKELRIKVLKGFNVEQVIVFINVLLQEQKESFIKGIEVNKTWSMIRTSDLQKLIKQKESIIKWAEGKKKVEGLVGDKRPSAIIYNQALQDLINEINK